jgi:hypothetical protein
MHYAQKFRHILRTIPVTQDALPLPTGAWRQHLISSNYTSWFSFYAPSMNWRSRIQSVFIAPDL